MTRVAVVQHPPVLLDRDATIARVLELLGEATAEGARLVTFPEAFVPGYPEWVWRLAPGNDYELTGQLDRRLLENSIDLDAGDLKPVQAAARKHKVMVLLQIGRASCRERVENSEVAILINTIFVRSATDV